MRESREAIITAKSIVNSINEALDQAIVKLGDFGDRPFIDLERDTNDE